MKDAKHFDYEKSLRSVPGLVQLVQRSVPDLKQEELLLWMEFVLHGLAEYSQLSKFTLERGGTQFKDLFQSMFSMQNKSDDDDL